jgi:hypothetical protein
MALLRGESLDTDLSDGDAALALDEWVVGRGRVAGGRLRAELDKKSAGELRAILSLLSNPPAA